MNKKMKFISCVMIIVLIALTGKTFAGMADMDDETSQIIANEMIANQEKEERENEGKSSNNYLSSLEVEGYTLSPKFDKQTLNYTIEDTEKDTITIKAETDDSRAKTSGTGVIKLNNGENNIRIDVTAENGTVRTYFVKITKKAQEENTNNEEKNNEKESENTTTENKETSSVLNEINAMAEPENQGNKADVKTIAIIVIVVAVLAIIVLMMPGLKKKKNRRR